MRTPDTRRRRGPGQASDDPIWRALSTKARREQPWCLDCGAVDDLTVDHVIAKSVAPELVHAPENVAVLCRTCNSRKGTRFAVADALAVLDRLHASYRRHPTRAGRQRIAAAEAVLTRGDTPLGGEPIPAGEAQRAMKTAAGWSG